jgi:hypothetical protein
MTREEDAIRFWLRQQQANQARNRLSVGRARRSAAGRRDRSLARATLAVRAVTDTASRTDRPESQPGI